MHIPDGFLSPGVAVAAYGVSVAVCAVAVKRAESAPDGRRVPLMGMCAAFIFAAQTLNFPVAAGTSGHFVGSVFGAILLGPLNACLVMAVVLLVQCLLFADGGITALGANVLNMGIAGTFSGWLIYATLRRLLPSGRGALLAASFIASWAGVVAVSALCALELALSDTVALSVGFPAMVGVHAVIGIGEGLITVAAVSTLIAARPGLLGERVAFTHTGEARG